MKLFSRRFQSLVPAMKFCSADEAVSIVRSSTTLFVQSAAMTPEILISALAKRAGSNLADVQIVSLHLGGVNELAQPEAQRSFRTNSFYCGPNVRQAIADGRADYTPCFLSEIPSFFRNRVVPVDVALVQARRPYCGAFRIPTSRAMAL